MKSKMLFAMLLSVMPFSRVSTYAQTPLILQINNKVMTVNGTENH